jgi:hypothetical protein
MMNTIVVGDLLPPGDPPLGNHEDLVAVRVDPQGVRLTRVVQQQQGGEHRTSHLANTKKVTKVVFVWGTCPDSPSTGDSFY